MKKTFKIKCARCSFLLSGNSRKEVRQLAMDAGMMEGCLGWLCTSCRITAKQKRESEMSLEMAKEAGKALIKCDEVLATAKKIRKAILIRDTGKDFDKGMSDEFFGLSEAHHYLQETLVSALKEKLIAETKDVQY